MSLLYTKSDRRILPRWRASKQATQNTDFTAHKPVATQPALSGNILTEAIQDFDADSTIGTAADLLSKAIIAGNSDAASRAIEFIRQNEDKAPRTLINLVSDKNEEATDENEVKTIRRLLTINPKNPMLWSDLARHFASIGDRSRAKRCMTVALQLAPNHRWILRTASRFLAHQGQNIEAHKLLADHPLTRTDPWLMAAELACAQAAGRAPKYWRQSNDAIRFQSSAPKHLSELATAIAMMELEAGQKKKAKKFVAKGLDDPTENTLAQIMWARINRHLSGEIGSGMIVQDRRDAYEAICCRAVDQGNLLVAKEAATKWGEDEPFAARPRAELAFIASLLDDYELTIEMACKVQIVDDERDETLELNSIFALLSSGKLTPENDRTQIESIYKKLRKVSEGGKDNAYHGIANLGLWCYRYGDKALGHEFYQQAIKIAEKYHLEAASVAATFAAREALLAKDINFLDVLKQAHDLTRRSKHKGSEFYLRKLEALRCAPQDADKILSPASAHKFLKPALPELNYHLENDGNNLVLYIPKKR